MWLSTWAEHGAMMIAAQDVSQNLPLLTIRPSALRRIHSLLRVHRRRP